jgi:DNA-binding NtrC family response regulator
LPGTLTTSKDKIKSKNSVPTNSKKIVVVDDEPDICYLLGNILRKLSCDVRMATTLIGGMVEICNSLPQIVFLDLNFPDGSSGMECIKAIRRCSPQTKIIVMSAMDGALEKAKAKIEGAAYFMSKPFDYKTVTTVLKDLQHQQLEN